MGFGDVGDDLALDTARLGVDPETLHQGAGSRGAQASGDAADGQKSGEETALAGRAEERHAQ